MIKYKLWLSQKFMIKSFFQPNAFIQTTYNYFTITKEGKDNSLVII